MKMKMFGKSDILLAAFLIAAGFAMSFFISFGGEGGTELDISVDGKDYGTYSLLEDQTITIKQKDRDCTNLVTIKDGIVTMESSTCSGQDCVKMSSISKTGETIVCLPNRVLLEIKGGEPAYDSISR